MSEMIYECTTTVLSRNNSRSKAHLRPEVGYCSTATLHASINLCNLIFAAAPGWWGFYLIEPHCFAACLEGRHNFR